MIYYVIKNVTTSEYYRGKGSNRWGKYYNQASIYRYKGYAETTLNSLARRGNDVYKVVKIKIAEVEEG